jgi:hypothetical protein
VSVLLKEAGEMSIAGGAMVLVVVDEVVVVTDVVVDVDDVVVVGLMVTNALSEMLLFAVSVARTTSITGDPVSFVPAV